MKMNKRKEKPYWIIVFRLYLSIIDAAISFHKSLLIKCENIKRDEVARILRIYLN